MKKTITSLLAAVGLVASASAATPYFGADVGYLVDYEEAIFTIRGGVPFAASDTLVHNIELGISYAEEKENIRIDLGYFDESLEGTEFGLSLKYKVTPIMANYRLEFPQTNWRPYIGAGIGIASIKTSAGLDLSEIGKKSEYFSASQTEFAAQVFAGVEYHINPASSVKLGLRYLRINYATEYNGVDLSDYLENHIDDVAIEAGFTFRF